jgi:ParB family chromosome partitioning protein
MSADDLDRLAASISNRGLLLPLRVKPTGTDGRHVLISGHRRLAALVKLGAATAECIVAGGPLDEAAVLAEQHAENIHREAVSPIQEAEAYQRYMALKQVTAARAAQDLHVPPSRLSRLLPLLDLPADVRGKIDRGEIPPDTAYHLTRLPDGDERDHLLARAADGTLTRDDAAGAVKTAKSGPPDGAPVARVTCKLAGGRSLTVTAGSVDLNSLIQTLEEVLKASRDARKRGWSASTLVKAFRDRAAAGGGA